MDNPVENRISTCCRCPHVGKSLHGKKLCEFPGDRHNIIEHATQNVCPAGMYGALALNPSEPTQAVIDRIKSGRVIRAEWEKWPSTREAHRLLMREFIPTIPVQPLANEPFLGHVYHDLNLISHPDQYRCITAMRTWGGKGVKLLPFTASRTAASELGDPRPLPFIKDLLDYSAEHSELFVWTNLDICLMDHAYATIRDRLRERGAYYSGRLLVADAQNGYADGVLKPGIDLFAFTSEWWNKHRDNIADGCIACEGWDWCLGKLIELEWPDTPHLPPILYHEFHQVYWHKNRYDPSAKYNRAQAREFIKRMGWPSEPGMEEDTIK